ncbi:hypothetical protein GORBP_020_00470, partial [Gordonia rubripertincta NBRC 101908]
GGITSFAGAVIAGIIGPLGVGYVFLTQTLSFGEYYELIAAGSLLLMAVMNPVGVAGAPSELGDRIRALRHRREPEPKPEAPGTAAQSAEAGTRV